ncbi:unnamed protein product, partial [Brassica rapa]
MACTTNMSSVGGGRLDPPSGSSNDKSYRRPRLIKAIQDLRTKLLSKQRQKQDGTFVFFFKTVPNPDDDAFEISDKNQKEKPKTSI